ncbi:hypothetical protein CMO89_03475 [Candidatus Woesearchaeota archaeon]|jgi:CxxC-x17-CxxC domain-containing protein|nr:hypothetical protein [Candidatus Woesearchaeota archaeon]|tara:strand:- start:850 stop:1266 length:417 start_codon:yes stop_codon:yes gene_type:complete
MGDFNRDFDKRRSGRSRGRDSGRFDRGRSGRFDRRDRGRDRPFERHEMHQAICDKCGRDCEVPFKPTQGKPLYCNDCFKDKGGETGSRPEFKRQSNEDFDKINKKLDRILKILEAAKEPVEEKPEIEKPKKKAKKKKS